MKNLDSEWKYTTKVNIAQAELLGRIGYYRQGASEFQEKALKELEKIDEIPDGRDAIAEVIKVLKNLKP